jgi:hypothetical protein
MPITSNEFQNSLRTCYKIWDAVFNSPNGVINFLPDGTIYAFAGQNYNITQTCCNILRDTLLVQNPPQYPTNVDPNNIYFDLNEQKCRWSRPSNESCAIPDKEIKIVLNPVGNDGAFFTLTENDTCRLEIKFDYLFKIKCKTLDEVVKVTPVTYLKPVTDLRQEYFKKESELLDVNIQLEGLSKQAASTSYSIICNDFPTNEEVATSSPTKEITQTQKLPFLNTGFGSLTNNTEISVSTTKVAPIYETKSVNFCLTDVGLISWRNIIGENNYVGFINGEPDSYTCLNVIEIEKLNQEAIINNNEKLLFECTTPFGEKTILLNKISELITIQKKLTNEINTIDTKIKALDDVVNPCSTMLGQFENLSATVTLDMIDENNVTTPNIFFSTFFGVEQNLYSHLTNNQNNSGFFVCGEPTNNEPWASGCTGLVYPEFTFGGIVEDSSELNVSICNNIKDILYQELYSSSGIPTEQEFNDSLSPNVFNSNWLTYTNTIDVTSGFTNNQIKLNIIVDGSCDNFCLLIDQISLTKVCEDANRENIFISQSPGFELTRVIDNKKSWLQADNYTERDFYIAKYDDLNKIRQTEYNLEDDRLILNSKEIDLTVNMASAVENDVWCYLLDYPNVLTGVTNDCSSFPITPSDIYGNPVTLPTAQTYSYNVVDVLKSTKVFFNRCVNTTNTIDCYPTTECFSCGEVIKFKTGDGSESFWLTCDGNGLGAYYVTDNTDAEGTINNISYSLTGNAITTLNTLVDLINIQLNNSFPNEKPYVKFWDDNGNCVSCCQNCGDENVDFTGFMTTNITEVKTLETFENLLVSELIDAKNRKTLSSYPTLRGVYDRYMNATQYGVPQSNEFTYEKMDKFTGLIKTYWDDLIEQVVPATTLWGSVKVYTNTMFDQQKYKYRSYTSLFCNSPLNFVAPPSPINGSEGQCHAAEVITSSIQVFSSDLQFRKRLVPYNSICLTQMNFGSEFVGNVDIYDGNGTAINDDSFCDNLCRKAVWYNMPESPEIMMNLITCGVYPLYSSTSFTIESFIINTDNDLINIPLSSDTINNENIIWVPAQNEVISGCTLGNPTGWTYSNFVDFLNETFSSLGVSSKYEARLSYKEIYSVTFNDGSTSTIPPKSKNGFYLLFPENDTFELLVSCESQDSTVFKYTNDNLNFGFNAMMAPYSGSWGVNLAVDYDCKTNIIKE